MHKIVIFDIDGTLIESLQAEANAYLGAFDVCYGITGLSDDWDSYQYRNDLAIAKEIIGRHFARPCTSSELNRLLDTYASLLRGEVYGRGTMPKLIPGVENVLDALDKRGDIGFALATANPKRISKLRLEMAGIWKYFFCGAFAEDGNDKTLILGKSLIRCREVWDDFISNENVIYIGDHPHDAIAAQALGVQFIGITNQPERLHGIVDNRIHSDYRDLNGLLIQMDRLWNNSPAT